MAPSKKRLFQKNSRLKPFFPLLLFSATSCLAGWPNPARAETIEADLLVVGGTESGCAAAVQATRMGVKKIVLVNDIEWLGGQFSAEGLGAIDENRAHGYDGSVPIPRSGIFRDVIDAIEERNAKLYGGVPRPGNTRVITTSRPKVSEAVFRELLAPFEKTGQLKRFSNYRLQRVLTEKNCVFGATFLSTDSGDELIVRARLTIDASDWGDVIQGSGAEWDSGPDAKSEYDEPSAPAAAEPATDMNPITWCMILEERKEKILFPKPAGYDARYFNKLWGWISEEFAYTSRRLVDGRGFKAINHPDLLLINTPPVDYPLDVYPADVATDLEATETGASKKNLVAMTPRQREIVFQDARRHTLKYYYHLQQRFPKFHFMALSDEFGTADKLPPKPYVRESLRLVAQHIVREQEVLGFMSRSGYATTMFPDAVFSWQFEMDFHPTKRSWTTDQGDEGPWEAVFRGNRRFHRGGTGRSVFPLRALVPKEMHGLLAAQKNLGYTSIVGSSCRLHDQSIHAGQASGAVAAVSLRHRVNPAELYLQREHLAEIWTGLLEVKSGAPLAIWPFSDVDPFDPGFVAIQQLALRKALPLEANETAFRPDKPASKAWLDKVYGASEKAGYAVPSPIKKQAPVTRRDAVMKLWAVLASQPIPSPKRKSKTDADGDGIPDATDPLPYIVGWKSWKRDPARDGLPGPVPPSAKIVRAINFTASGGIEADGFTNDSGGLFGEKKGFGWRHDLSGNTRLRNSGKNSLRNSFVFTRGHNLWEYVLPNGKYLVDLSIGDLEHKQLGQNLTVESQVVFRNLTTPSGHFAEKRVEVEVQDGTLTIEIGLHASAKIKASLDQDKHGNSNTCLNWIRILAKP
jgi:hypothetical protein